MVAGIDLSYRITPKKCGSMVRMRGDLVNGKIDDESTERQPRVNDERYLNLYSRHYVYQITAERGGLYEVEDRACARRCPYHRSVVRRGYRAAGASRNDGTPGHCRWPLVL